MIKIDKKHSGVFAAGVLFGTAGIKLLSSKDAKKVYANCTAAVLRAKDCVMKTVSKVQENAEDIYAVFCTKNCCCTVCVNFFCIFAGKKFNSCCAK